MVERKTGFEGSPVGAAIQWLVDIVNSPGFYNCQNSSDAT
jgi:hypothetical protein